MNEWFKLRENYNFRTLHWEEWGKCWSELICRRGKCRFGHLLCLKWLLYEEIEHPLYSITSNNTMHCGLAWGICIMTESVHSGCQVWTLDMGHGNGWRWWWIVATFVDRMTWWQMDCPESWWFDDLFHQLMLMCGCRIAFCIIGFGSRNIYHMQMLVRPVLYEALMMKMMIQKSKCNKSSRIAHSFLHIIHVTEDQCRKI